MYQDFLDFLLDLSRTYHYFWRGRSAGFIGNLTLGGTGIGNTWMINNEQVNFHKCVRCISLFLTQVNPISHGIFFSWLPRGGRIPPPLVKMHLGVSECNSFLHSQ